MCVMYFYYQLNQQNLFEIILLITQRSLSKEGKGKKQQDRKNIAPSINCSMGSWIYIRPSKLALSAGPEELASDLALLAAGAAVVP